MTAGPAKRGKAERPRIGQAAPAEGRSRSDRTPVSEKNLSGRDERSTQPPSVILRLDRRIQEPRPDPLRLDRPVKLGNDRSKQDGPEMTKSTSLRTDTWTQCPAHPLEV